MSHKFLQTDDGLDDVIISLGSNSIEETFSRHRFIQGEDGSTVEGLQAAAVLLLTSVGRD